VNDDHVGQLLEQLAQTARDLNRASSAIHNVTTQHAQGAEQQANVITEATMILDEFRTLADQSREQARILSALAQETQTISSTGHESVSMAIEEMQEIERQVTVIASRILALAENTQRIGNIMATVSDIATQSNFLALNASIQAARAGTQGEGFAIVAQEVRDLAQQSKVAASEVRAILREIQNAMKHTITATESGAEEAQRGVDLADKAREVILKLSENITRSTDTSQEILSAVEQQTGGMEQVVASMQDLNRVTMQNLASTRMAEAVAQNLSRLSGELSETLEKFEGNHHES
jgi:methyl-accepting chemotaxis protein